MKGWTEDAQPERRTGARSFPAPDVPPGLTDDDMVDLERYTREPDPTESPVYSGPERRSEPR